MVEVELPMEYKLRNIEETEKAKQELLIPVPKPEKIFEIPRNYNQDYSSHSYQKMKIMESKRKNFEKHLKMKHDHERKHRRLYGPSGSSSNTTGGNNSSSGSSSGNSGNNGNNGNNGGSGNAANGDHAPSSSVSAMSTGHLSNLHRRQTPQTSSVAVTASKFNKRTEFKGGAFAPDALKAPSPKRRYS
ncbi:hypothetical protein RFI_30122 [Reticulomyxa filosa]|uniref:Uncharacterized protein n=1 Tax=Reticulomyxa filosa TaxID=46433 RepID=X6M2P8_RETFI|nr:hypothetical protein RFI_30122 [Reticulomyxa filosa]|eukprot:ETO07270.1 hypothetical protein RFI_30122 [Reticulomyxa filosa]